MYQITPFFAFPNRLLAIDAEKDAMNRSLQLMQHAYFAFDSLVKRDF